MARPTRTAAEITREEYEEGRSLLYDKLAEFRPSYACFVGKGVYTEFCRLSDVPWGLQERSVVDGVHEFVAPSSSGLVRMPLEEVVGIYTRLHELVSE